MGREMKIQEKRDAEVEFEEKLEVKENTLQEIIKQNAALREEIVQKAEELAQARQDCEKGVANTSSRMQMEREEQEQRYAKLEAEKVHLQMFVDNEKEMMKEAIDNDPEKLRLRKEVQEHEEASQTAVNVIAKLG